MRNANEAEIRRLIAERSRAINAADVEGMTAILFRDVVTYDIVGELRDLGSEAARAGARNWLELYARGPFWQDQDVTIVADRDVAFAYMLSHVTGQRKDGVDIDMWFRTTLGFRHIDRRWQIVHEHQSEPFDIQSGKARLDLKP